MCSCTQLLPVQKHLQYNVIETNNIIITVDGLPMVETNLTFMGDQKLSVNDLSFVKVLFILEMETCFISGIWLARVFNL